MEIAVKGHSGCKIDIVREGHDIFIYKSTKDKRYQSRLVKQAKKQEVAAKEMYQHIRVPHILNVTDDGTTVSVKMEYIYGKNFIEYFESAGFEQISFFINALINYIEKELESSVIEVIDSLQILTKFRDVKQNIESKKLLNSDAEIKQLLRESEKRFCKYEKASIKLPIGRCHGDLTFSNILFNGNNYYLIDFLDSFIESPLIDIVKLRQDSSFMWSQQLYIRPYDELRMRIISEKIDCELNRYFHKYQWYDDYYDDFQLLNLLRVLQYAHEENVIDFLKTHIKEILGTKHAEPNDNDYYDLNCEDTNESSHDSFNLIIPAAGCNKNAKESMPYIFALDQAGYMLSIKSVMGLDLTPFDNIYFTILRKHSELFGLEDLFKIQFKRLGWENAHVVILDEETNSQAETVYQTIIKEHIDGGIFIKDADGYFEGEILKENSVAVFPLDQLDIADPKNKSYVAVDDMYFITNMIEKRLVSRFFNVGGSCFEDVKSFCRYYLKLSKKEKHLCVSHIIYSMLLDSFKFRPIMAKNYSDWGNIKLSNYHHLIAEAE